MKILKYRWAAVLIFGLLLGAVLQLRGTAGATGSSITGRVTTQAGSSIAGAYVYASAPASSTILYGPIVTSPSGYYTLNIPTPGTYDIHVGPPSNTGYTPVVNSEVSVTTDQTINVQLSSKTNTISGVLTDSSNNPLPGVTIKLFKSGSPIYQTTTDTNGSYSISAPASYYYLHLTGSMNDIPNFTLSQSNTSAINLLSGDMSLNLTIHTAIMTVTTHNNAGQQASGSQSVSARATAGITSLYPGDTGTTISLVNSTGFSAGGGATGTIKTIVGATYTASGLETPSYTTSICQSLPGSSPSAWDCLRLPLTVTSDISIGLPMALPATRNFSGVLKDGAGAPIANAQITLIKYNDTSTYATTDANGSFSINAMPKKYYLKVMGGNLNGIQSYVLTQSSSNPSIDLTASDKVQNLQIETTTLTVTAYDGSGNLNYSTSVNAQTSSGTTTLYAGDPGESVTVVSNGFSTSSGNATGTIGTIIGASYSAKGLHSTNPNGSICTLDASPYWNCLTAAFTAIGPASINVPQ